MDLRSEKQEKPLLMELRYGKPQGRHLLLCSGLGNLTFWEGSGSKCKGVRNAESFGSVAGGAAGRGAWDRIQLLLRAPIPPWSPCTGLASMETAEPQKQTEREVEDGREEQQEQELLPHPRRAGCGEREQDCPSFLPNSNR